MRFYLDHNMPYTCVEFLKKRKHNVVHAKDLGYETRDDRFHYQEAKRQKRVLITNDSDFLNNTRFPLNKHPGIVIINASDVIYGLEIFFRGLDLLWKAFSRQLSEKGQCLSRQSILYEWRVIIRAVPDDLQQFPFEARDLQGHVFVPTEDEILFAKPPFERIEEDMGTIALE